MNTTPWARAPGGPWGGQSYLQGRLGPPPCLGHSLARTLSPPLAVSRGRLRAQEAKSRLIPSLKVSSRRGPEPRGQELSWVPAGGNGHPGPAGPRAVATQRPAEWEAGRGPRTPRSPQNQACPLAQHSLFHMDLPVGLAGDVEVGQGALVVLGVRAAQHQLTPRLRTGVPGRREGRSQPHLLIKHGGRGRGRRGCPPPHRASSLTAGDTATS